MAALRARERSFALNRLYAVVCGAAAAVGVALSFVFHSSPAYDAWFVLVLTCLVIPLGIMAGANAGRPARLALDYLGLPQRNKPPMTRGTLMNEHDFDDWLRRVRAGSSGTNSQ